MTNGGTINGTVKWTGAMPHLMPVAINKDPLICDPNSQKTRDLERLIVGPRRSREYCGFSERYFEGQGHGFAATKTVSRPEVTVVTSRIFCWFRPAPELQMKSSDATLHTIHMDGAATYNLPFPFTNQLVTRKMSTVGLVNLRCNGGHTWMNAEMFVVPHPYYAVTDESGKFEFSDVPPGEYQIVAWHEGWKVTRSGRHLRCAD